MVLNSSVFSIVNKSTLAVTSLALMTTIATPLQAASVRSEVIRPGSLGTVGMEYSGANNQFSGTSSPRWLMAGKDDQKQQKRDREDWDYRSSRVDLNRAKNLARQAAEAANGGIRVYRAEASMHGPVQECPYVDNGDSWTFTFLGGRPGARMMTTESVVKVYKNTPRVVVAYNGTVRQTRQTRISSFTTSQRTVLTDLIRGNCGCNALLSNRVRTQMISQARSLPPGMQKQLLRGKGLPPGIAKQWVVLPKQVNSYINLPTYYDLVVIGSNLVLLDQTNQVVDLIASVL